MVILGLCAVVVKLSLVLILLVLCLLVGWARVGDGLCSYWDLCPVRHWDGRLGNDQVMVKESGVRWRAA